MGNRYTIQVKKHEANSQNFVSKTRKPVNSKTRSTPADKVLFLQRTIGNQAVQRLVKSGVLQAKLKIGQPGDIYEQEADRVADAVMRMPQPEVALKSRCPFANGSSCKEKEEILQTGSAAPQVQRVPQAAAVPAALAIAWRCVQGGLLSMALDAAIQYGIHLWRLRRWPWERAQETWDRYRHDWCSTFLSFVLGCFGGLAAHRWIQPFLRRSTALGGAAGATILGRFLMWLATQGILAPRIGVKWLSKLGCIWAFEAEALYPGITSEEEVANASPAVSPRIEGQAGA